jgi:hypothetical protein
LPPAGLLTEQYETLRAAVVARHAPGSLRLGQGVLMARGMAAWMQVATEGIPPRRVACTPGGEAVSLPPLVQKEAVALMREAVMALLRGEGR